MISPILIFSSETLGGVAGRVKLNNPKTKAAAPANKKVFFNIPLAKLESESQ